MVFERKSGPKGKQQTPKPKKKAVKESEDLGDIDMDFDESDSNDSESDNQMKKKTPVKTPKAKQGDKRVSFNVPGKNTPANKTPKSENSVGKKQPTPGKAALKEFQGMLTSSAKKNGGTKRPAEDDDDDDDDDDEDDDDDDDDDEDADLDMMLDGGSDDDDDDDDDEDEDDDDEDDDDEEDDEDDESQKPQNAKQQSSSKSTVNKNEASASQKTPLKNLEKTPVRKAEQSSKKLEKPVKGKISEGEAQSPSKEKAPPGIKKALELDAERKRQRDARTLYMGNLPMDITPTELKALSSDIIFVNIPTTTFAKKKRKTLYAFLEFANEAKAEENFKILKNKKLRGQPITLDFTGDKRKNLNVQPNKGEEKSVNLKKLFVPSLPDDVTIDQLAPFFKKAFQITLYGSPSNKVATINFFQEKDAAEALEGSKTAKIGDKPLHVMFSLVDSRNKKKRKKNKPKTKPQPSKKMKLEVKQESDDDDEDDDDDDDDDDE